MSVAEIIAELRAAGIDAQQHGDSSNVRASRSDATSGKMALLFVTPVTYGGVSQVLTALDALVAKNRAATRDRARRIR